jgi:hypothetical protein
MAAPLGFRAAGLSAPALLRIWEAGAAQHPLDRALTILAAAEPGLTRRDLASLPSGRRDQRLLAVYERTFGNRAVGQGRCPECGEVVEFDVDIGSFLAASSDENCAEPYAVVEEGYEVTYRLPNSFDLAEIGSLTDVNEARRRLIERCIQRVTREGAEVRLDQVPEVVIGLVVERMAVHDPLADIELAMTCPACGAQWQLLFDIVSFLWRKIEAQAGRLLREVHTLARAYGWREADILAMSPGRRQAYLEMVS